MYKRIKSTSIFLSLFFIITACGQKERYMMSEHIKTQQDVQNLFPTSPEQILKEKDTYIAETKELIGEILNLNAADRTFENTAAKLDDLCARSNLTIKENTFEIMLYLHPNKAMRDAAHEAIQEIKDFYVDNISKNKQLFEAFKSYVEGNALKENLNDEQQYYLQESMKSFKRAGLDLPDDQLSEVRQMKKELSKLIQQFDRNIADDQSKLIVDRAGLIGLEEEFINSLERTEDGKYILGVDYPTFFQVTDNVSNEKTRKNIHELFSNRAYPANEELLKQIIALRDAMAKKIGYESYGHLDLDNQMVKHPDRADQFLHDLIKKAKDKENRELDAFIAQLPESISLTEDGKIKSWDLAFLKNNYKEKTFAIDERKISEYFPMQKTVDALLDVYHQFLGVNFKEVPVSGMWHEDVRLVKVFDSNDQLLGYLFLDLHPRPNKYSHAAHAGIVPALKKENGTRLPAMSVVMANFPKPINDKPALLMRSDVQTFFHEFGHALHALLGATQLGSFAGTRTKTDFVELPSQMLEEWLFDKNILNQVSSHYITGEPLPDEIINNIIALKQYDSGGFIRRQSMLALISLYLYKEGADKNPKELVNTIRDRFSPRIFYSPNNNFYASFGHLTGYGSKYYGYLWSKVFALDLFDTIKQHGLLNPAIGTQYISKVIGRGGSKDPNELLKDFLGREPNQDAFLKDMGLQ